MNPIEAVFSFPRNPIIRLLPVDMATMRNQVVIDLTDEDHREEMTIVKEGFKPIQDIAIAMANGFAALFETKGIDHMHEIEGIVG